MAQEPAVTIPDVTAIRALRLYHFTLSQLSELEWYELFDAMFMRMNPGFGSNFLLHHLSSEIANVRIRAMPSKEQAAEDTVAVLRTLDGLRLQAFIQVCPFKIGVRAGPQDIAWIVSFMNGARCTVDEAKAQVVFLAQAINVSR